MTVISHDKNNLFPRTENYLKAKEVALLLGCSIAYVYKLNSNPNSCIPKGKKKFGQGQMVWRKDEMLEFISNWKFWK